MSDELLNRARELLVNTPTTAFAMASAFPKMADTIRDLLAEVERLNDLAKRVDAERSYAVNRAEAAESSLRELASAEAVAATDGWGPWRDVSVHGFPESAQEVLFVRGGKVVHGAFIGGLFWHSNQYMAAALWMPFPEPLTPDHHRSLIAARLVASEAFK